VILKNKYKKLCTYGPYLELGLYLSELPPGEDLYVRADLLARARLAGAQLDVARNEFVPAVHLALIGEDDLATAAGRVDRHRLLEALLNVWRPDAFCVLTLHLRSSRSLELAPEVIKVIRTCT
jgi:hypothetical protein